MPRAKRAVLALALVAMCACTASRAASSSVEVAAASMPHSSRVTASAAVQVSAPEVDVGQVAYVVGLHELHAKALADRAASERASRSRPRPTVQRARPLPGRPATAGDGCGGWRNLVGTYFHAGDVGRACRILMCESSGNPNARNGSHNGLMQIAGGTFDPEGNIRHAAQMAYTTRKGWSHWECK